MALNKVLIFFWCGYLLLTSVSAHRQCQSCISLNDLLAEAYGIEISMDRLSSAIAFHNGTMAPAGTVGASPNYKNLMQPILDMAVGEEPRKVALRCPESRPRSQPLPFDRSFLDFLIAVFLLPQRLWKAYTEQQSINIPTLHPTARLIQDEMRLLPPFNDMNLEQLSQLTVDIQIPSWLTGTEEACHIASAAKSLFGPRIRIESPPSSAYTAAGYELCRISHDAFECTGPGDIMTLEYDNNLAVASIMQTPLSDWSVNPVTFAARRGLTTQGLIDWIDSFIDSQNPDRLIIAGANADHPAFVDALENSRAAESLDHHSPMPPSHILVFGAALAAKVGMESQIDDCGEWEECIELRRKADAMVGSYRPLTPSVWPAMGPGHGEL